MINVRVIGVTKPVVDFIPDSEDIISYAARVSNPSNQTNFDTSEKLLQYCVRNSHWSIFEMVNLTMEIECPRDIARQILRHRSFSFQEFSQRYAEATDFITRECRMQDTVNRQNSVVSEDADLKQWWEDSQYFLLDKVQALYQDALDKGIAKEVARCILPEGLTMSKMYMNGTLRSWLHYVSLRSKKGETQYEHVLVAEACREAIKGYFPVVMGMLGGNETK